MEFEPLSPFEEEIGSAIVDAAYKVHASLGPGLLEKIYEMCIVHELKKNGYDTKRQVDLPVEYDGLVFDESLRIDILVENLVIVETKAINQMNPLWQAQVLSHLRLSKRRLGYLINFNVSQIKNGIRRYIL